MTPDLRILDRNDAPVRPDRDVVLYWMIAARRTRWSFGLQRAVERARALGKPLVVLEPLRVGYRWASVRHHTFVVQGMVDNAARFAEAGVTYLPYVEPDEGAGKGLLAALASRAAVVVTDHYPTYFLPRMVAAAGAALDVRLEAVDGLGILPLAAHGRTFTAAQHFRRHLHKTLRPHLQAFPEADPLAGYDLGAASIPDDVARRWPAADLDALLDGGIAKLPIDREVGAVSRRGGEVAGRARLDAFLDERLGRYDTGRNDAVDTAASGLSPWLHFGHVGAHEIVHRVLEGDGWHLGKLATKPTGSREGWWGCSSPVEAFLDEVITWREIGHGFCHERPDDHADYDSLPDWALKTLAEHADDPRETVYTFEQFERAETHDPLWNAAQHELRRSGVVHNYLRMLWGKKILHWTDSPQEALRVMLALNDRWAIDGRDPNSLCGIFWVLGRFDRAWGPERPIFGKVRYMTSASTERKLRTGPYVARWTP